MQDKQIQILNKAFAETKAATYLGIATNISEDNPIISNIGNLTVHLMVHYLVAHCKIPFEYASKIFDHQVLSTTHIPRDIVEFFSYNFPRLHSVILRKLGVGNINSQCYDLLQRLFFTNIRPLILACSRERTILVTGPDAMKILCNGNLRINTEELQKQEVWIGDLTKDRFYKNSELPEGYFKDSYYVQSWTNSPLDANEKKEVINCAAKFEEICKQLLTSYSIYSEEDFIYINPKIMSTNTQLRLSTTCRKTDCAKSLEVFYSAFQNTFTPSILTSDIIRDIRSGIIEKMQWFLQQLPTAERTKHYQTNPLISFSLARLNWSKTDVCVTHLCHCWEVCESIKDNKAQKKVVSYLMKNVSTMLNQIKQKKSAAIPSEYKEKMNRILSPILQNNNNSQVQTHSTQKDNEDNSENYSKFLKT